MPTITPLPKELPIEFLQRCIADDSMVKEFPDLGVRHSQCMIQLTKHEVNNGKSRKTKKDR